MLEGSAKARLSDLVEKSSMLGTSLSMLWRKWKRFQDKDSGRKLAVIRCYLLENIAILPVKLVLTMLMYIILWAFEPFWKIRIGIMKYQRMPSFGFITELFLRRRILGKDITYDTIVSYLGGNAKQNGRGLLYKDRRMRKVKDHWIFLSREPANRFLMDMIKRRVTVVENPVIWWIYDRFVRQYIQGSRFHPFIPGDANDYEAWNNVPPQLSFTSEEKERGLQFLESMGVDPNVEFVCFFARDSAYAECVFPDRDYSYHDYRNCDIDKCVPAAEYIALRGMFALRMGYIVEKPTVTNHRRVIDYASYYRSDFGDIYLCANCKFFLGNGSGLVDIPLMFNRPVALTNMIDTPGPARGSRDLTIFKKLWLIEEKRFLTFREIINRGIWTYIRSKQFAQTGIEIIENSEDEILALAKEMNERLDGTWVGTDEDEELQKRYRAILPPGFPWEGFPGRIGAEFLRQNCQLLD